MHGAAMGMFPRVATLLAKVAQISPLGCKELSRVELSYSSLRVIDMDYLRPSRPTIVLIQI